MNFPPLSSSCYFLTNFGFQFLPPESYTMLLQLEELDLHSFQPDHNTPFQVQSVVVVMRFPIHFGFRCVW